MSKFEEVSSDGHEVSLTGELVPEGWSRFNVSWVMVIGNDYMGPPMDRMTDRQENSTLYLFTFSFSDIFWKN